MLEPNEDGILMELQADGFRRVFAVTVIYLLGVLFLWIAFARPPALGWAVVLVLLGAGSLTLAEMLRRSTQLVLQLTLDGLQDTSGGLRYTCVNSCLKDLPIKLPIAAAEKESAENNAAATNCRKLAYMRR